MRPAKEARRLYGEHVVVLETFTGKREKNEPSGRYRAG